MSLALQSELCNCTLTRGHTQSRTAIKSGLVPLDVVVIASLNCKKALFMGFICKHVILCSKVELKCCDSVCSNLNLIFFFFFASLLVTPAVKHAEAINAILRHHRKVA